MKSPLQRWSSIDRLIPSMGLLVFSSVFYRALRLAADFSEGTLWLWLYGPHEMFFGFSTAAISAFLVAVGAVTATLVVWMEASHLGFLARTCSRLATTVLAAVLVTHAYTPFLFRAHHIDASIRLLQRYGDRDDQIGWQSEDVRSALRRMGIEVAPSIPADAAPSRP